MVWMIDLFLFKFRLMDHNLLIMIILRMRIQNLSRGWLIAAFSTLRNSGGDIFVQQHTAWFGTAVATVFQAMQIFFEQIGVEAPVILIAVEEVG